MTEGNTIISLLIKRDGNHVLSTSEEYNAISQYFISDDFAAYAANAEVDSEMLVKISEGVTNFIRECDHPSLEYATNAIVACTNGRVGSVADSEDVKVVFTLEINSGHE